MFDIQEEMQKRQKVLDSFYWQNSKVVKEILNKSFSRKKSKPFYFFSDNICNNLVTSVFESGYSFSVQDTKHDVINNSISFGLCFSGDQEFENNLYYVKENKSHSVVFKSTSCEQDIEAEFILLIQTNSLMVFKDISFSVLNTMLSCLDENECIRFH